MVLCTWDHYKPLQLYLVYCTSSRRLWKYTLTKILQEKYNLPTLGFEPYASWLVDSLPLGVFHLFLPLLPLSLKPAASPIVGIYLVISLKSTVAHFWVRSCLGPKYCCPRQMPWQFLHRSAIKEELQKLWLCFSEDYSHFPGLTQHASVEDRLTERLVRQNNLDRQTWAVF